MKKKQYLLLLWHFFHSTTRAVLLNLLYLLTDIFTLLVKWIFGWLAFTFIWLTLFWTTLTGCCAHVEIEEFCSHLENSWSKLYNHVYPFELSSCICFDKPDKAYLRFYKFVYFFLDWFKLKATIWLPSLVYVKVLQSYLFVLHSDIFCFSA